MMNFFKLNIKLVSMGVAVAFGLGAGLWAGPFPQSRATANAAAAAASSTQAAASEANGAQAVSAGTKISTELKSSLDARTAKPGQQVEARVTKNIKEHGRTVIHKGDTLLGHVTNVQSSAGAKSGSEIGLAFDQLRSHGTTTQLNTVITSVLAAQGQAGMQSEPMPMPEAAPVGMPARGSGGGGLLGGVGSTVGSTAGVVGGAAGGLGATAGAATGATLGASGGAGLAATPIRAIHLNSGASADSSFGSASTLSTQHGNLRLDSGTRMEFRVAGGAQASRAPHQRQ